MSSGYEALRHDAGLLDLSSRGRIIVRGRDRARLLHNVTSNEIKKMEPGSACYAFLLSPQGRIQADLYLLCFADYFLIDVEPELREKVLQHIKRYIIADQVELEDISESSTCIGLEGPTTVDVLKRAGAELPASYAHTSWGAATIAGITATGQPGVRIYCGANEAAAIHEELLFADAQPASVEDARVVRIENGKPRYGEDIFDKTLPQETRQMHAISFTKGCYLGQEIVERIRAQGHVNKQLARLEIAGATPPPVGSKASSNGSDVGEITSAVHSLQSGGAAALAYLRTQFAASGTKVAVAEREAIVTG
jgi:folate-binding protein YgfZ